jgi:protein SCO1
VSVTETKSLPRWILAALATSVAVVLLAAVGLWRLSAGPDLPVLGTVPPFTLTDQEGRAVRGEELKGKVALVGFIYTSCTDICPMLTHQMRGVQLKLQQAGLLGTQAVLYSITVDPEHDTPAVLRQYAAEQGVDTATWRFLTGDPEQVRQTVVKGFMLGMEQTPGSYAVSHSGRIALVDKQGRIRAYYDGEALDFARVLADIEAL